MQAVDHIPQRWTSQHPIFLSLPNHPFDLRKTAVPLRLHLNDFFRTSGRHGDIQLRADLVVGVKIAQQRVQALLCRLSANHQKAGIS